MNNTKTPGTELTPWALVSTHIKCGELIATLEELKTKIDELAATRILDMVDDGMSDLIKAGIVELARPVEAKK